jgi:hypothetical protein
MPTKREREYYRMGFNDGRRAGEFGEYARKSPFELGEPEIIGRTTVQPSALYRAIAKPKRKLSAWNKYVKANSKKPRFRYRNGKLNLKKMAVAFRKTPAGRKKRR